MGVKTSDLVHNSVLFLYRKASYMTLHIILYLYFGAIDRESSVVFVGNLRNTRTCCGAVLASRSSPIAHTLQPSMTSAPCAGLLSAQSVEPAVSYSIIIITHATT
jgi:hypothetical protein